MENSLPLCKMLEEEYASLHGPLPKEYPAKADHETRLKEIYRLIHGLQEKRSALCLSGGGIRSATFALGVIQGFARHNLLDKFDYLSTVSGGGYVGSWLTAWAYRHEQSISGMSSELGSAPHSQSEPELEPIQHLRNYSNYLSPKLGLLSADTWTLVGIYLRNLLLIWQALIPLLVAALAIPRLCVAVVRSKPMTFLPMASLGLGFALGVMAIVYIGLNRPSISRALRDQLSFLKYCLVPLLLSAILLTDFWAWHLNSGREAFGIWIMILLGASRKKNERRPNPFTGFDPKDNLLMSQLGARNTQDTQPKKLLHVVNMALNLVRGDKLAWQQRKAESFTVSPLHSGSRCLGYRSSNLYAGGISLGTAVTISGAAASPNMGYHSSPIVTFLLALFNARLGWWLGNPGSVGEKTYFLAYPKLIAIPLLAEAFGLTNDQSKYVYLSDGGHFENLGLYEMVLRRCRFIILSDAGCDPKYSFDDLGNAIRKIRIDFGIPIEFKQTPIPISRELKGGKRYAIAKIGYSRVDGQDTDGLLLYIKPTISGDEPADVVSYHKANPVFPHEPTSDQWFSESQFESYRILGEHTADSICDKGGTPSTLDALFQNLQKI